MTQRLILIAGLLALIVFGGLQTASAAQERRVVVVVDATDPAVLAEARAAVEAAGPEAQLRVPRTPTEQLSVTRSVAAQGYRLVVGVGLERDIAVAPVAAKYPQTRFVAAEPGQVADALRRD